MLTKEEVIQILQNNKYNYWKILKYNYKDFYDYIEKEVVGTKFGEKLYKWLNINETGKCLECGNNCKFDDIFYGYKKFCSSKCSNRNKEVKNKKQEKCIRNYGVSNPSQSDLIKNKKKETCIIHFGVDCNLKLEETKKKIKQTNLKKYGTEYPIQSDNIRNNILNENYQRFFIDIRYKNLVLPLFDVNKYKGVEFVYKWRCKLCNGEFYDHLQDGRIPRCYKCFPIYNSLGQKELYSYIKSLLLINDIILENDRIILGGKELDIYIPRLKLAIEYNGLYYHSEITGGKDKNYHIDKLNLCEKLGIQLVNIFEDGWINRKEEIKTLLYSIIFNKEIDINNSIGISKSDSFYILDRCFYNKTNKFSMTLKFIENISPTRKFLDNSHTKIILENSNDWIWDCGYLKFG